VAAQQPHALHDNRGIYLRVDSGTFGAGRVLGQGAFWGRARFGVGFYVGSGHLITGGDSTNTETHCTCVEAMDRRSTQQRCSPGRLHNCLCTGLFGDYTGGTVEEHWDVIRAQQ